MAFEFEPIAAAFDYESRIDNERLVLVADIGGGTSDFSIIRAGIKRHAHLERRADILANHDVHIAGTDFDRNVNLAAISPALGYRTRTPNGREVPSTIYFELATWHLINTVYSHARQFELRMLRPMYEDARAYARLRRVVQHRLGHQLAAAAEKQDRRVVVRQSNDRSGNDRAAVAAGF